MIEYRDAKGQIRPELLDKEAREKAESFIKKRRDGKIDERESLNSHQLRRFYNDFKRIQRKISKNDDISPALYLIAMQKSKAEYASNPRNRKIPGEFKAFIEENVDTILKTREKEDFEAFMLHFEAVVGFFYGMGIKNN